MTHLFRSQAEGPRPRPPRAEAGEAPPPQARWETPVGLPAYVPVVINGVPHSLPLLGSPPEIQTPEPGVGFSNLS